MAKDKETPRKEVVEKQVEVTEIVQECDDLIQPQLHVTVPSPPGQIIEDQTLVDLYQELLQQGRDDRRECDGYLTSFVEMVINEGDSTTASKEALVNLMKIKSDITDKMSKIASEMTKLKLKEKYNENPKSIEAQQTNHYHIGSDRRALIELIEDAKRENSAEKKEKENEESLATEENRKKVERPYKETDE